MIFKIIISYLKKRLGKAIFWKLEILSGLFWVYFWCELRVTQLHAHDNSYVNDISALCPPLRETWAHA